MKPKLLFAAALSAFLGLYLAFPDKVYVFDGVMFSFVIERRVVDVAAVLFNRRHLLFNPLLLGIRDFAVASGYPIGGYELIQKVNAFAAVAGLLLFFRLVLRLTRDQGVSAIAALFLGLSYAYWSRATEGQVYMLMTLGALAVLWSACALQDDPRPRRAAALAAAWAGAVLFHIATAVLLPVAAWALWRASPAPRRGRFVWWLAAAFAAVSGAYAAAFHLRGPSSLLAFLLTTTEFRATTGGNWGTLIWDALFKGGFHFHSRILVLFRLLYFSFFFCDSSRHWAAAGGVLLCVGLGVAVRAVWPRLEAKQRDCAAVLAGAGGLIALQDFLWEGAIFFWALPAAAFAAVAALVWAKRLEKAPPSRRHRELGLGLFLVLATGSWNLYAGIRPQSRIENNAGYRQALFVRDHTAATSWVITSGLGFPNSKVYLTEFARRSNRALEYYLRAAPKAAALAQFRDFLRNAMAHGLPVYVLSDLVDDRTVADSLRRLWGVTPEEVRACFGAGRFVPVAAHDGGLRIFLFVPDDSREALFVGLAFNVLDMNDPPRLRAIMNVMRVLGTELTPEGRRRAEALLKETRYGALAAFAGMSPYLDEQTRGPAQEYARTFMQAPTPEASAKLELILGYLR